jgi:hypothetical protein
LTDCTTPIPQISIESESTESIIAGIQALRGLSLIPLLDIALASAPEEEEIPHVPEALQTGQNTSFDLQDSFLKLPYIRESSRNLFCRDLHTVECKNIL